MKNNYVEDQWDKEWYAAILKKGPQDISRSIESYAEGIEDLKLMKKRFHDKQNKEVEKSLIRAIAQWESRLEKLLKLEKIWQEKKL